MHKVENENPRESGMMNVGDSRAMVRVFRRVTAKERLSNV